MEPASTQALLLSSSIPLDMSVGLSELQSPCLVNGGSHVYPTGFGWGLNEMPHG